MGNDPVLTRLMALGCVDAFDVMLGQKIGGNGGGFLGAYVSRAFRQGHMAVRVGQDVVPSVRAVFSDDGFCDLDTTMEQTIEQRLKDEMASAPGELVVEGEIAALPYAHALEVQLAREVKRLSAAVPFIQVKEFDLQESLNDGQKAAVIGAQSSALCLLTGGPGTGKTYTAGVFLRALVRASPIHPLRVAVVAPTGRAVQTLFASIAKALGGEVALEAKTIHSLVSTPQETFLPYHVVIVDEGSMIGSHLMLKVLQRLHTGTRVMILGDADQLPSIDPGQPFFELLAAASEGMIRHFALQGCQRTTSKELLEIAQSVREGDCQRFEKCLCSQQGDVVCIECENSDDWKKAESIVEKEVVGPWRGILSMEDAVRQLRTTTLLTPCRKGYWGTDGVNARAGGEMKCTPVVCTKNSYHLGVMNGDLGVLQKDTPFDEIHFDHCTVPRVLVPRMEHAFAMTVHKAQGGEFDTVVMVIPPGALIDRRLLYTAITRAKRRLVMIGQKADLIGAVRRRDKRVSTLSLGIVQNDEYKQDLNSAFKKVK